MYAAPEKGSAVDIFSGKTTQDGTPGEATHQQPGLQQICWQQNCCRVFGEKNVYFDGGESPGEKLLNNKHRPSHQENRWGRVATRPAYPFRALRV